MKQPVFAAVLMSMSTLSHAANDLFSLSLDDLMQVEIYTASQETEKAAESPVIVSVITAKQLREWGVLSVHDALSYLPGIFKTETYLGQTTQTFRGVTPGLFNNKSLFLINGHPTYGSLFGRTLIDYISLDMIDRIEVVRSPASVLYGTNAMSGVINIITRQGQVNPDQVVARVGSNDHLYGSATYHADNFSVNASIQRDDGYGYDETLDEFGNPVNMDYQNDLQNLFLDVYGDDWRVNAAFFNQAKARYGVNPWVWQNGINDNYAGYLDLNKTIRRGSGEFNIWARYDLADIDFHAGEFPFPSTAADCARFNVPAGPCAASNPDGRDTRSTVRNTVERYSLEFQYKDRLSDKLSYIVGASFERNESDPLVFHYDSDGAINPNGGAYSQPQDSDTQALYGQVKYQFTPDTLAIAGLRGENNSDAGTSDLVPRIGVTHQVVDGTYLKLLYSEAFRIPVFIEKHVLLPNVLLGNEDLDRETIKTLEFGVDSQLNRDNNLQATVFLLELEDEILRQPVADPNSTATEYVNGRGRKTHGLEVEWKSILAERWELVGNASYTDGKDNSLGVDDLPFVASQTANVMLTYHASTQWKATWSTQYVSSKDYLLADDSRGSIDAYSVSNLVLAYNYKDTHQVDIGFLNLFDEEYTYPEPVRRIASDVPGGPGATGYLTYRYNFQ